MTDKHRSGNCVSSTGHSAQTHADAACDQHTANRAGGTPTSANTFTFGIRAGLVVTLYISVRDRSRMSATAYPPTVCTAAAGEPLTYLAKHHQTHT
jgi:hypothetical protein